MNKENWQSASEVCKRYRETHKDTYYLEQERRRATVDGRLRVLLQSAKTRSKTKNILFTISLEQLQELYRKQDGVCAISKLKMELTTGPREKANNHIMSLDRIIPKDGYVIENLQLVCLAVNRIKWNFTDEEFKFWLGTISSRILRN